MAWAKGTATTTPLLGGERPGRDRTPSHSGDTVREAVDEVMHVVRGLYVGFERKVDEDCQKVSTLHMMAYWATVLVLVPQAPRRKKTSGIGFAQILATGTGGSVRLWVRPAQRRYIGMKERSIALMHANEYRHRANKDRTTS